MDLRHLRYFVAVAEERNFSRAAARLHMAQPPLSQQIKQLEGELGFVLLRRSTRRVDLTPAGAVYLERARGILAAVDGAAALAARVAAGRAGRLTIGCVGSATYSLLPAVARRMRAELPEVELAFRGELTSPDQTAALHAGTLDLGLLRPPVDGVGLTSERVRRDRLWAAVPTGHPLGRRRRLRVVDLRDQELVVHAGSGGSVMHGLVQRACRAQGFEPLLAHEVAETSTLVTFVAAGLGIAVVPEPTAALAVPGVAYVPLSGAGHVDLVAVTRDGDDNPVLARALAIIAAAAERGTDRDTSA